MRQRSIVILTPGRTGSSMLAAILQELGVVMGQYMDKPNDDYAPLGVHEDNLFWTINHAYLTDTYEDEMVYVSNYAKMLRLRQYVQLWGLKDPQAIHTFHLWHYLMPDMRIIVSTRDMEAAVQSYIRAFGGSDYVRSIMPDDENEEDFISDLLHSRMDMINSALQEYPYHHIVVDYDAVLENPIGWVGAITSFVYSGMDVVAHPNTIANAVEIVDPNLRNF